MRTPHAHPTRLKLTQKALQLATALEHAPAHSRGGGRHLGCRLTLSRLLVFLILVSRNLDA